MTVYNYLRQFMTQDQIMEVASYQKKGHLIGANGLKEPSTYTVTLHHNYYNGLMDRMPRLRSGDVQVFNIYADSGDARVTKKWYDDLFNATSSSLTAKLTSGSYHFGVTSNGSISTEGGMVEVTNSFYKGVLTPLRNNQTDVTNSSYTGAIRAYGTRHELLSGTDSSYMASPQSSYTDSSSVTWMVWAGDSSATDSSLGPTQATPIDFAWHNGELPTPKNLHTATELPDLLTKYAGAGKVSLTAAQWMNANN
ncbi:MAG: hypothetical protein CGU28_16860 [Candidatus Dactylopiibacterium carminicum]|nr:MAG: hypothetical protein CGU28_16860 [Candidatus Dactylopiibacterium carminicum]